MRKVGASGKPHHVHDQKSQRDKEACGMREALMATDCTM